MRIALARKKYTVFRFAGSYRAEILGYEEIRNDGDHDTPNGMPTPAQAHGFLDGKDEAAFAELVKRHGPLVYCTAIKPATGNRQDFLRFFRAGLWFFG